MQSTQSAICIPSNWLVPLSWNTIFERQAPLEVDVGCGKGSFLLHAAQENPNTNFIGVDRLLRRLRKIDKRIQRVGVHNIRLFRVEASYFVSYLVPEASISAYHIYFPDPWPKRRHQQRRLMSASFVSNLRRTLRDGGAINCATDHAEYYQWIHEEFRKTPGFLEDTGGLLSEKIGTDFEQDFLAAGKRIFRCRWIKG